jgi:chromosomal replication initiation ATPase DnaA
MEEKTWFEKLGYEQNPFIIKPYAFEDNLQGYRSYIKKVNSALKRGRVVFIEGDYGVGKTSALKQIIDEFSGKRKLIYYSANRSDSGVDFETLIKGRAGPIARLFGIKPKQLILMIDEAQKLTKHDCEKIEDFIDEGYFKSVVLVSDDIRKTNLTAGLKRRIGDRILQLGELLTENHAVRIVKDRLGRESKFISPKVAKLIFERAGKNPRRMLEYMEDISRYVVEEKGADKVTEEDVVYVLA